jgi:hypothetical protein
MADFNAPVSEAAIDGVLCLELFAVNVSASDALPDEGSCHVDELEDRSFYSIKSKFVFFLHTYYCRYFVEIN